MNKKVPYGLSNFESIIKGNYLYVDKTQFIEKIETSGTHYISFFRPRRFGKSLSVSMLEYYYDFAFSKKFNELFENLYIGKNQTSLKNNYLVLRFDFSGIETNDAISTRIGFIANIIAGINNFNFKYNILSNKEIDSLKKITYPGNLLKEFFGYAQKRLDKKFYILVDEYDHFANELLAYDMEKFKELLMERGFVRKFYEVIKSATMNIVDRVFITGVTPITLDSLTSGFNIDSDLTYDLWFHDMMGFTEEEVKFSINESSADCNPPVLELLKSLKEYYNGYKFNEDAGHFVFNPEMVLYFLNHFTRYNNFPRNILDTNIASDYSKLKNIFKIGDPNKNFEILKEIAKEKKIKGKLIQSYDLVTKRFTEDDFISLLYYMGMLTIDRLIGAMIEFVIPNYVIKKLYYEYFLDEIFQKIKINVKTSQIESAIYELAYNNKIDSLIKLIEEFLTAISNRDFIKFDEKYVKLAFILYLSMSDVYIVKSEYETEKGYIDLVLLKNPVVNPPYEHIFEIKYMKREDSVEEQINKKIEQGKNQIKEYMRSIEFSTVKRIFIMLGKLTYQFLTAINHLTLSNYLQSNFLHM